MTTRGWLAALAVAAVGTGVWAVARPEAGFPHRAHEGLFPTCLGCHSGVTSGEASALYPSPKLCTGCHDGMEMDPVEWDGPVPDPSNLRFSHLEHERMAAAQGEEPDCQACHGRGDGREYMAVGEAEPVACLNCHAHRASEHLAADADCATCHSPLAEVPDLSLERVAAFAEPPSHAAADFLETHGPSDPGGGSSCAVCHARQSCERCHLNGSELPAVAALPPDPRVAELVAGARPSYPLPATHREGDWRLGHGGDAAADPASCANCHARPSCRSCHIGSGAAEAIAALPEPRPGGPAGVTVDGDPQPALADDGGVKAAPGRGGARAGGRRVRLADLVHVPGFDASHEAAAAADQPTCSGCHEESFCSDCHDSGSRPRFHPGNFMARHGAEAWARDTDCASCHSTETFCRACHTGAGRTSMGRLDVAYHGKQGLWLLQHGQAARQQLESCTSCHVQRDCMQCHSRTGGWGISPHGPGFDPERVSERNRLTCMRCHPSDPL